MGTQASVVKPCGAGAQRAGRLVGAVAGVPERAALGLVGGPGEAQRAVAVRDRLDVLGLRLGLGGRAVELEHERRSDLELQFEVAVDGVDLGLVEQLDARDRDGVGEHFDHGVDGAVERPERAGRGGHRLRRGLERAA